jgi:hypothetical protein
MIFSMNSSAPPSLDRLLRQVTRRPFISTESGLPMKPIVTGALMALAASTASAEEFLGQKPEFVMSKLLWQQPDRPMPSFYTTAKEWLPACEAYIGEGWTWGLADFCATMVAGQARLGRTSNAWGCAEASSDITRKQGVRVVVRYIEARPQRMDESFLRLAFEALADAWPCRKGHQAGSAC